MPEADTSLQAQSPCKPTNLNGSVQNSSCAMNCPLAQIPASVWKKIFQPSFRQRHPWIFWIIILLLALCLFALGRCSFSEREMLASEGRIALVSVRGPIIDPAPVLEWLRTLERKAEVKGILLRVDSPGGGAAASQEIYSALARLAQGKPIAASMGATAASGGLMVSMAAERIFANPSTITGSIGVRMDIPQLQGLLSKIGVGQETLVTAPFKDAASYLKPLSPEDRAYFEKVLMDMHEQFVGIVAKGRKMSRDKASLLASGKIFTGQEAKNLGLVDELGGQDEAQKWLCEKTGVPLERKLLLRPKARQRLLDGLLSFLSPSELEGSLANLKEALGRSLQNSQSPLFLYQF